MGRAKKMTPGLKRAVARRYGFEPDGTIHAIECTYCGAPGAMTWQPVCTPVRLTGADHYVGSAVDFVETTMVYDHIVPIYLGGPHTAANILMACWGCNGSKGHRDLAEWQAWLVTPLGLKTEFWVRFWRYAGAVA